MRDEIGISGRRSPEASLRDLHNAVRRQLALRLAAYLLLDLFLLRTARLGLLALGSGLLAGSALQLLSFLRIFNLGGICH